MSHHIYHTEALILGGIEKGEGDRLLFCYTRELGLLLAHAKSLREVRSRLRYTLQTFAHADIDLIRGKHGWKLISARPIDSHSPLWQDSEKRQVLAQHMGLLKRLIQGEGEEPGLFDDILFGLRAVGAATTQKSLRSTELLLVVRLLERLGYWGEAKEYPELFDFMVWQDEHVLSLVQDSRTTLIAHVNRALRETQL